MGLAFGMDGFKPVEFDGFEYGGFVSNKISFRRR